jgi:flagellar P-ring protein precursor FlgI
LNFRRLLFLLLIVAASGSAVAAPTVRIKDIAFLRGVRENQVLGLGLVTGLAGKGDSSSSALLRSTISTLVSSFGLSVSPQEVKSKNCAVVMMNAELPPFARPGDKVDVVVSSIGDARDLDGGVLLQATLQAANGQVYAVAQGRVAASSDPGAPKTVGTVSLGAIVEKEVVSQYLADDRVSVVLRNPDFVTADAVRAAIQAGLPGAVVASRDPSLVEVQIPEDRRANPVGFIAQLEALTLTPDVAGKVVIDSSTGVIVIGEKVRIGKVAVSYRNAKVTVGAVQRNAVDAPDLFVIGETTTVDDFVSALKAVGMKTDALIGVMRAVEKSGALFGTLVVI